jgi:hypothetical protein
MSAAKHTPGPWIFAIAKTPQQLGKVYPKPRADTHNTGLVGCIATVGRPSQALAEIEAMANARLVAAAPELLAAIESEYIFLADIHNEWPGRHSPQGQLKLCRLRDLICKATGREAQDVQDDYGNRNLAKAEVQS